jgi:predicted glycosyltransferase involved in capsule biosynthesis
MYCDNEGVFHRTQYLNMMLSEVKTPVVVNYDIDILLDPSVYLKCQNMILGGHDLVYPYSFGESQKQIKYSGRDKLISNLDIEDLSDDDIFLTLSKYGHCQFFNTESYIGGGMENEGFISYGPEDIERAYRFEKLGYKVVWNNNFIYHIEHSRGFNSSTKNPYFEANEELYEYIKSLSDSELCKYYNEIDYLKKYRP